MGPICFTWNTSWISTQSATRSSDRRPSSSPGTRPDFRFLPFLRIPIGATRDEVRAAVGEGWAWYNPDEPHGVSKTADETRGWFFSAGIGTDDGWRFGVWFDDESGRVKEKDAYYWYD